MSHWADDAFFYHMYPLGLLGAPPRNDGLGPPEPRLSWVHGWLDHLEALGVDGLYLGPVFQSSSHGYDTADYFTVDRRLGTNADLARLVRALHDRGIRVVLDAVFHHVGRDHFAFRDLLARGESSPYRSWFSGVRFDRRSPMGDPFTYDAWNGCAELVKLDLSEPAVREHLFEAVGAWVRDFDIDGLRLDAADVIDRGFLRTLADHARGARPGLWLLGEVIHGDYRLWLDAAGLDSVTNYEAHKGLYSSHVDRNYFELAHTLDRQFGDRGLYRGRSLYSFADNHDVDRVASRLREAAHLYPLHLLLFTMPGVPSVYYGSEWGLGGRKRGADDGPLRPALELEAARAGAPHPELAETIARLARVRRASPALRRGDYETLLVKSEQLAFRRSAPEETVIVAVNAADETVKLELPVNGGELVDRLAPHERFRVTAGRARVSLWPRWGRVLAVE